MKRILQIVVDQNLPFQNMELIKKTIQDQFDNSVLVLVTTPNILIKWIPNPDNTDEHR